MRFSGIAVAVLLVMGRFVMGLGAGLGLVLIGVRSARLEEDDEMPEAAPVFVSEFNGLGVFAGLGVGVLTTVGIGCFATTGG